MPKEPSPLTTDTQPPTTDIQNPVPAPQPPPPSRVWFGATLEINSSNKDAITEALSTLLNSHRPMYLLEVEENAEMLIAVNRDGLAVMGADTLDRTVPRYFSNDWKPERDLRTERSQDTFQFAGTLKCFDGSAKQLKEIHCKIAPGLWLVTIG